MFAPETVNWLSNSSETKTTNLRAQLIYSSKSQDFKETLDRVTRNASENNVQLEFYDAELLTQSDERRFLNDTRSIPPQFRGQVKSGKGRTLPISGTGKLNRSIPILIVYEDDRPRDVFPRDLMGVRRDVDSAFSQTQGASAIHGVESSIVTILSSKPDIIEPGLVLYQTELETGSGVIDLVFKDKDGNLLAIEVKEDANQETVGQVLKQANGLKNKLGLSVLRRVIVALRASQNVEAACRDAGIELYLVTVKKTT